MKYGFWRSTAFNLTACTLCASLATTAPLAMADAAAVASLYGPQAPADASFLRVLNASSEPIKLVFTGGGAAQTLAPYTVTRYAVLRPGEPLRVTIDSRTLSRSDKDNSTAVSGEYVTLAVAHNAQGWQMRAISTNQGHIDGLKATLQAYNFVANCSANISVAGTDTMVFKTLAEGTLQARAINPVKASVVEQCGTASSAALPLPQLAAGDSYSLFVIGNADKPMLVGARDSLAWPPTAR
jgi:hypothetical protein